MKRYNIRRDGKWVDVTADEYADHQAKQGHTPRGLGDVVHAVAQPIARVIDRVAGTKLAECGGCARRRAVLNRIKV